jgi:2-phospho-L-lactate guanylyltransferase (CobY/MobA/RfbA family)
MQEAALPTQLEILRKSRDRVVAKRGADDPFVKSLDEKIAAAEKAEAKVTITVNADLPAAEKTSIAEAGKTQTAPRSGKQSNTKFRVKTQGAARSR